MGQGRYNRLSLRRHDRRLKAGDDNYRHGSTAKQRRGFFRRRQGNASASYDWTSGGWVRRHEEK